ncbi:MAG: hypothetical protein H5U40_02280, partial [Polyangiaceae bacterium]|nr:hypothetical protein [Polyangiaceae bacterium]
VLSTGYGPERVVGTGPSFTYTPAEIGLHPIRVSVVDSGGKRASARVNVVAMGDLAQRTLPNDVRMEAEPGLSGSTLVLRSDGLAARWASTAKEGIRANQAVFGAFRYFEVRRLGAVGNQAGGVVIGGASLDPYPFNTTPASCSLNTIGGVYQNLISRAGGPYPAEAVEYYGFAVDYRDDYPIVHILWSASDDPADFNVRTVHLEDATVPIYPMLYGSTFGTPDGTFDIEANFGATPFHYDPAAILAGDATGLELCWADIDCP